MRKTKIICTIGPACENEETLTEMCLAGMNVARLNFSHGSHEEHQKKIDLIRQVREKLELPIAIMLDTKGPEYRIRTFENGSVTLKEGDAFTFTTEQVVGDQTRVAVNYAGLIDDLSVGDTILLNNGLLSFRVEELTGAETRICVPGHMQRGGSPSAYDRVLATQFGSYAAKLVEVERYGVTVAMVNNRVVANRLEDIAGKTRNIPEGCELLTVARRMGVSLG